MSNQIVINTEACIGCEGCVEICPVMFGFDNYAGKAYVMEGAAMDAECIDEAISLCPVQCISRI